jgi:hypothetical protein
MNNILRTNSHPVLDALLRWDKRGLASPQEKAVIKYGRAFTAIERPKGYRQRALKACFMNAGDLALVDRGTYVEGFAFASGVDGMPVHHAWLTVDGVNTVDVTWRGPIAERYYYGIPFSNEVLREFTTLTRSWGPLLFGSELEKVLRDAGLLI